MLHKSYIILLNYIFMLILVMTANAQVPVIDQSFKKEFFKQKSKHYQQLYKSQQQITENQEEYDVKYYSLNLIPDPSARTLSGEVEVVAEVIGTALDHVELNFWDGMTISDVHKKDSPDQQLSYTHSGELLSIDLDTTFNQGEEFSVIIGYSGQPQYSIYGSFDFDTHGGKPIIGTLSEPYGARAWWPCKDVNSDKADSVDIRVTVLNEFIVASNGTLRETTTEGELTTYWWHEQYPIATYLVSIAIHPYVVYYDDYLYNDNADTMKIHFYQYQDNSNNDYIVGLNAKIKDMISYFSEIYGQYPFIEEKYGHADYHIGGAMEHQTCSSFAFWNESVFAHELAHQWWGDLVTCDSFHHIWLNEGFASYSEALWYEHAYPGYTASEHMMSWMLYQGAGTIYVEDPESDPRRIFHGGLSYDKGAWVMHMLRHVVGSDAFFEILKTYGSSEKHRYGTATTSEFQEICENISGLNLNKFFQQWIYGEYFPHYSYGWNLKEDEGGYQIQLAIDQIQDNAGIFWMPIDVKITTSEYDTVFVVWDSLASQTFELFIEDKPLSIELDPSDWILKKVEEKLLAPYAHNVIVNNTYQIPVLDTLVLTTETENPQNQNLDIEATIQSLDMSVDETIKMYDDGGHSDGEAGDGIYGTQWPVPLGEKLYKVIIKTLSLDNSYYNIFDDAAYFTTMGPVVLDYYEIVSEDTVANPGDFIGFKFYVLNTGLTDTVYNIITNLISLDSCTQIVALSNPEYGDIAPGESADASRSIRIRFDPECPAPATYQFALDVYSDDHRLWRDTFSVNVITGLPDDVISATPKEYALKQNYPNPFNPSTTINYELPIANYVELEIYNMLGQVVTNLVSEKQEAGFHQAEWDASGISSGVYFYKIQAGKFQAVKKMILLR